MRFRSRRHDCSLDKPWKQRAFRLQLVDVINVPCLKGTNTLIVFVPTAMFLLFESPVRDGVRKISMSQMFLVLKKS